MTACIIWGVEGGIEPVRTLRSIAVNGGKDPEVIDAAACTFLHEGREAVVRCAGDERQLCDEIAFSRVSNLSFVMKSFLHHIGLQRLLCCAV
jgi:hypothetical protein